MRARCYATVVVTEKFVRKPYKLIMETRRQSNGLFAITLVARDSDSLAPVVNTLTRYGYEPHNVKIDRYNYVRITYRDMDYMDIAFVKKIIHEEFLRKDVEEEQLVYA